jgi:hypothetical protein
MENREGQKKKVWWQRMKLTQKQKDILMKIQAPYLDKSDLNDKELDELCDYITDYVIVHETANDEVSSLGEEVLNVHDDILF